MSAAGWSNDFYDEIWAFATQDTVEFSFCVGQNPVGWGNGQIFHQFFAIYVSKEAPIQHFNDPEQVQLDAK
jgi:hypothetical protein